MNWKKKGMNLVKDVIPNKERIVILKYKMNGIFFKNLDRMLV